MGVQNCGLVLTGAPRNWQRDADAASLPQLHTGGMAVCGAIQKNVVVKGRAGGGPGGGGGGVSKTLQGSNGPLPPGSPEPRSWGAFESR